MSASNLLERAIEAKDKDIEKKPPRSRTMATRVVEEVYQAYLALAREKDLKPSELHRKILYAYLDQIHRSRRSGR
jgi:hypothetical protein